VLRKQFIAFEVIVQQALDFDFTVVHPFELLYKKISARALTCRQIHEAWALLVDR
jgi:hypothetical protein